MPKLISSFQPLFKMLKEKGLKKKDLAIMARLSASTITKMGKDGATVSSAVLEKICKVFHCQIGDILTLVPEDNIKKSPIETQPQSSITSLYDEKKHLPETENEHGLFPQEQKIVHFIYEQIHAYKASPPQFMIDMAMIEHQAEKPNLSPEEAKSYIGTDRYYSLVLNEVFEKFGKDGYAFERKRIPFSLIESGHFEIKKALTEAIETK